MDSQWCCLLFFEPLRCASFELFAQVTPLEVDLASWHIDMSRGSARGDSGRIEPKSTLDRFGVHGLEILGDERLRRGLGAEPDELGMMPVSFRRLSQHCLGEQSFSPQRDQTASIEMSGMNTPETHAAILDTDRLLNNARLVERQACGTPGLWNARLVELTGCVMTRWLYLALSNSLCVCLRIRLTAPPPDSLRESDSPWKGE